MAEGKGKTKKSDNLQTVEVKRRKLANRYRNEEKSGVSISPMYRPYFGNKMAISINGIAVYVPCDGKMYHIPKSFATEAKARMIAVNEMLTRKERMTNISSNVEASPGDLKFF